MAKQVIWSFRAQQERIRILEYWNVRNSSKTYSNKLDKLIREAIKLITLYPHIGRKTTTDENVKVKVVREYLILYENTNQQINILSIWDSRQNPEKLEKLLHRNY
ncbi:MAG: type II toxin-antitoxin system RelE/ParE family toxin [Ignavibacteriae bacterium]|nr:type II toxin-antitoxin system RelE/ParE family toxin [Ignavibacteriota bacterium]